MKIYINVWQILRLIRILFGQKRPVSFEMVFTTKPFLGADLLSSIDYSEQIKIETFCEIGLSNIQIADQLNRSAIIFYELSRCQPHQAKLAQWPFT